MKKATPAPVAKSSSEEESEEDSSEEEESEEDSSEDEAPPSKKVTAVPGKKSIPAKAASSSSEDSSSSDEEAPSSKPVVSAKKPLVAKKADSSSSEDSSSDEEEEEEAAPAKKSVPVKKEAESSESDESSDDEEEEEDKEVEEVKVEPVVKKTSKPIPVATTAAVASDNGKEHKIYVKGLPWKVSEEEVKSFFADCAAVNGSVITSVELPVGEDGRASGTAFVKFSNRSALDAALLLDGQLWPGTERWLKIQEGLDKPNRKSFGGGEGGVRPEGCDTVFLGNLPWDCDEEQIRGIFGTAGEISSVRFATGEDGAFRGFGHLSFYNPQDTEAAIKLAGTDINGRAVRVDYAPPRNRDSSGGGERGGRGGRGAPSPRGGGGRGGGGRGGGRGGRGAPPSLTASKSKGSIAVSAGKKMTFDE